MTEARERGARAETLTRRRRRRIVLAQILGVALAFYTWTGTTETINPFATGYLAKLPDAYNQLTSAFLKGHLNLLGRTPPEFLALKDPYDPAQNGPWSGLYHDLAYYKGHFFLQWGPTPVVTLLMPWRLLQHGNMPVNVGGHWALAPSFTRVPAADRRPVMITVGPAATGIPLPMHRGLNRIQLNATTLQPLPDAAPPVMVNGLRLVKN